MAFSIPKCFGIGESREQRLEANRSSEGREWAWLHEDRLYDGTEMRIPVLDFRTGTDAANSISFDDSWLAPAWRGFYQGTMRCRNVLTRCISVPSAGNRTHEFNLEE